MAGGNSNVTSKRPRIVLILFFVLVMVSLAACGEESTDDACMQGPLFASARSRAERAIVELDRTITIELEEAVLGITDQVSVLREISPRSLRDPLGVVLAAYGQLVVALDAVGWDPVVASSDPRVATARSAFAEESVSRALTNVEDFLTERCDQARGAVNAYFALTGTSLPLPEMSEEPSRDALEDDSLSASEWEALGFAVAEAYGIAVTKDEASCIALRLGSVFADGSDDAFDDVRYFDLIVSAFDECGVATTPTTMASSAPTTIPGN